MNVGELILMKQNLEYRINNKGVLDLLMNDEDRELFREQDRYFIKTINKEIEDNFS